LEEEEDVMKNRNKIYGVGFVVALISAAVIYPVYAADKSVAKCGANGGGGTACKQVIAQNDDDSFGSSYGQADWDPFVEFIRMQRDMNNLLNGTFNPYQDSRGIANMSQDVFTAPACDIKETGGNYIVTIDLPGMKKSDINISIDGNILTVSGERISSTETKDGDRVILQERTQGSFRRAIRLSSKINKDKVEAEYRNGTLTITLPHEKQKDNSIQIPIK
jgi:HSP20 family protein